MKLTRQILAVLAVFVMTAMGLANAAERITFVHNDVLGSPVAATNETGDVLWRATFQPYGERNGGGGFEEEVAYTGQIEDKEIGLIDYGARTYDPAIGRFLSIDPVGFEESNFPSFNRYSYANNSPYRYVDPDGRAIETVLIDIPSLIISAGLFAQAPGFANGVGLLVDLGATLIPGVPGGVGLARQAGNLTDITKVADPSTIRFTQSSVGNSVGTPNGKRPLRKLVKDLSSGRTTADDLPPIRVFEKDGVLTTLDNRRLKAAQVSGKPINTIPATAKEIASDGFKFTSKNGGTSVKVRGGL